MSCESSRLIRFPKGWIDEKFENFCNGRLLVENETGGKSGFCPKVKFDS